MLLLNHTSKIHKVFCLLLKADEKCHINTTEKRDFLKSIVIFKGVEIVIPG